MGKLSLDDEIAIRNLAVSKATDSVSLSELAGDSNFSIDVNYKDKNYRVAVTKDVGGTEEWETTGVTEIIK